MAVLHGKGAFLILVFSTKKRYSSFLKMFVIAQKICFKVKVLKTLKIYTDCHIKTSRSLRRKAILKISSTFFRRTFTLSVDFEMKPLKAVSCFKTKSNPNFAVRLAERSNHSFLLSIWWITFFKYLCSLVHDNGIFRPLCKHIKKIRSSQAAILVLNWLKNSSSFWVSLTNRNSINFK